MRQRHQFLSRALVPAGLALAVSLAPLPLLAQADPPPAPPADSAAPPPPPPPPAAATVQVETKAPPPATPDPTTKPISANVWGRIGTIVGNGDKLDDVSQNAEVDVLFSGDITKNVKWQGDFVGTYGPGEDVDPKTGMTTFNAQSGRAGILDLIGKIELDPAFNLWVGRMLVPSDRANFAGPWFMAPWNYPGFFGQGGGPIGPREGAFGRNDGATVWGQFGEGTFKYYVGAFDLYNKGVSPLYTARLNLALLSPEPGFYHSATYYGKDILALAVGGQYQKNGSGTSDFSEFNTDLLFEKNLGDAGVFDAEAALYLFKGDGELLKNDFYGLVSYLVPMVVGIGKFQPLVRFQGATPKDGDMWQIIDGQIGYAISDYSARLAVGFQHSQFSGVDMTGAKTTTKANQIFLGFQLQK
jgi:hypothetical protein